MRIKNTFYVLKRFVLRDDTFFRKFLFNIRNYTLISHIKNRYLFNNRSLDLTDIEKNPMELLCLIDSLTIVTSCSEHTERI